jgi:hypothetical protein
VTTVAFPLTVAVAAGVAVAATVWWYRRFVRLRSGFVAHIEREAPEMTVRGTTATGVRVEILGVGADIDLASLARRRPKGLSNAQWFAHVADELRAQAPRPNIPPLALVQDRILPMLRPTGYARLFDHYRPAQRMAWRSVDAHVAVTYVVTGMHQVTAVTEAAREAWALTGQALHDLAVTNLRAETAHVLAELNGPRRVYEHIDAFDATRLLVADMLVPDDVGDPVFAIPEETVLALAPRVEQARLAGEAVSRHAAATRPLSPMLYRFSPNGPVPV